MTLRLVYMAPPAYLLIGCILMLIANERLGGIVTRQEFVRGMIVWPLFIAYFFEHFLSAIWARLRG